MLLEEGKLKDNEKKGFKHILRCVVARLVKSASIKFIEGNAGRKMRSLISF